MMTNASVLRLFENFDKTVLGFSGWAGQTVSDYPPNANPPDWGIGNQIFLGQIFTPVMCPKVDK